MITTTGICKKCKKKIPEQTKIINYEKGLNIKKLREQLCEECKKLQESMNQKEFVSITSKKCIRCSKPTNGLPVCVKCRAELKDFDTLVDFIDHYIGINEDIRWLIKDEIAGRQSSLINSKNVEVISEPGKGVIAFNLIGRSSESQSQKIEEINILRLGLKRFKN